MGYFYDVPAADANSAHVDENRPLNMGLLGKAVLSFFCQEKRLWNSKGVICFVLPYCI